jgi:hypothetical protein
MATIFKVPQYVRTYVDRNARWYMMLRSTRRCAGRPREEESGESETPRVYSSFGQSESQSQQDQRRAWLVITVTGRARPGPIRVV